MGEGGGGQAQGNSGGSAGVSQAQLEFINIALGSGKDQEEGRPAAKKDDLGQVEDQQQEVKGHGKGGGGEGGQAQGGSGSGGISQARLVGDVGHKFRSPCYPYMLLVDPIYF